MLFVPNAASVGDTTETRAFVLTFGNGFRHAAWSEYRGWNFTCGCRTLTGNMVFGDASGKLWVLGNKNNEVFLDYANSDQETEIAFDWITPWLDFGARGDVKNSKYIGFDTRGKAEFTCDMFVDRYEDTPVLSVEFSGGSQGQYGNGPQPFGGGRNTSYERLYAWPTKFKIGKLRFHGTSDDALAWVSIILHYQRGSIRR